MNTHTQQINAAPITAPAWPMFAALGAGTSAVLTAVGTFWDVTGQYEGGATMDDLYGWLTFNLGVIAVATALVFGLVVRTATTANAGRRALVLALVALPSVLVFWTGLPAVLAVGAIACALVDKRLGELSRMSQSAVAISVLTLGGAIFFAITG